MFQEQINTKTIKIQTTKNETFQILRDYFKDFKGSCQHIIKSNLIYETNNFSDFNNFTNISNYLNISNFPDIRNLTIKGF